MPFRFVALTDYDGLFPVWLNPHHVRRLSAILDAKPPSMDDL